jgi:septal ring factor EnvC (AmiA/AmiB activator)
MFDKLKNRITTLETQTGQLKAELAKAKDDLAETKRLFSKLTGEIAALRRQTDAIMQMGGIVPAYPRVRRTDLAAEGETS